MPLFIEPRRFLVFITDPGASFDAERVKTLLEQHGCRVTAEAEMLTVRWANGPAMYISITRGPTAKILASRLSGAPSEKEKPFSDFDAYVEVSFDNLDEMLDEINSLIEVQARLQDATGGWVYRAWNQSFSRPDA